jgi:hypothetical protein
MCGWVLGNNKLEYIVCWEKIAIAINPGNVQDTDKLCHEGTAREM